jgi:S1-C subfamily serine protease
VTVIAGSRCVDGLQLQDLSAQLAEYFGVDRGVLVVQVAENATLGLRAGDVIRAIGGRDVEDVADVRRILSSYEGDENVEVTIVRRGETMAVRGTRR